MVFAPPEVFEYRLPMAQLMPGAPAPEYQQTFAAPIQSLVVAVRVSFTVTVFALKSPLISGVEVLELEI